MRYATHFFYLFILFSSCVNSQEDIPKETYLVGGPCEGCEAVLEYGDENLEAIDTLPTFEQKGQQIKVSGTIYKADGVTPAENVILYIYHTDQEGNYPTRGDETGWGKRHGYIRGWMKTGENGKYTFYTLKPGAYPSGQNPAHIHATILEPNGKYYYIDEYHFKGDSLLNQNQAHPQSPRGGTSGLLDLQKVGSIWVGKRDLSLGKNISGYN